jgi:hypothetical protein
MASVYVREIGSDEYDDWDQFVCKSPQGTIFQTSGWLSTCASHFNKKFKIYGCFENGHIVAGCSFYLWRKAFLKNASSAFPTTSHGGILVAQSQTNDIRNQESYDTIMQSLRISIERNNFNYIQLFNSPSLLDVGAFVGSGWKKTDFYAYYLFLSNFEEEISKKLRWTMKKASKNGITIEKSNDLDLFYPLLEETFEYKNLRPFASAVFYKEIFSFLQNSNKGEMWIAKSISGEVCAAEIIIYDEKRAYRWSSASHPKLRKTGAPSLLLYELLKDLKERGFKEVDLMAGPLCVNTFLRQFKPRLVPFYCLEHKGGLTKIAGDSIRWLQNKTTIEKRNTFLRSHSWNALKTS